jgi:hypothetical protein
MSDYEAACIEALRAEAEAAAAYHALEATAPGTQENELARIAAYYADLAHGDALFEQEQLAKEARYD